MHKQGGWAIMTVRYSTRHCVKVNGNPSTKWHLVRNRTIISSPPWKAYSRRASLTRRWRGILGKAFVTDQFRDVIRKRQRARMMGDLWLAYSLRTQVNRTWQRSFAITFTKPRSLTSNMVAHGVGGNKWSCWWVVRLALTAPCKPWPTKWQMEMCNSW